MSTSSSPAVQSQRPPDPRAEETRAASSEERRATDEELDVTSPNAEPEAAQSGFKRQVQRATTGRTGRWLEWFTRFGYHTRGLVFALVGLVALRAAWGIGAAAGTHDVIREMGRQPYGRTLLVVTTVGLAGYVLWRFVQVVLDPFTKGGGAQSDVRRIGYFGSGLFYGLMAFTAAQLAFDLGGGKDTRQELVAWALEMPYGSLLVGFAGIVLIAVGLHAFWRAWAASYMSLYPPPETGQMSPRRRRFARRVGRVGLTAMGLTLCLIGTLVILAAVHADPNQAVGIGGALGALQRSPHGAILVAAAGVGMLFYALHCFALGAWRRVRQDGASTPEGGRVRD